MTKAAIKFCVAALSGSALAANYNPDLPWKYDDSGRNVQLVEPAEATLADFDSGIGTVVDSELLGLEARAFWRFVTPEPFICDFTNPGFMLLLR